MRPLRLLAALVASLPAPALAKAALFTVAIGYNGAPAAETGPALTALRFADDDAASFHQFGRSVARSSFLLTVMDAETQRRFPGLAEQARPPSLQELERVVAALDREVQAAERAGDQTVVMLSYSGHGVLDAAGNGSLTLLDGSLTRQVLYDRVLAPLRARYVHLLIDACHAESVVRPRDAQAEQVEVSPAALASYMAETTLARFPNVGTVVAASASAQSHEWDAYGGGVFTHEVLSGLRGAADVNGDRLVEYSELAAFLAAANGAVLDPRARLDTVVRPPSLNPRAPLANLRELPTLGRLRGRPSALGAFFLESARGVRLVDLRTETGFAVELALPAGEDLFLRTSDREAELRLPAGAAVQLDSVTWRRSPSQRRGALESSLQRGLFATNFGPAYYRGFVDRDRDLIAVEPASPDLLVTDVAAPVSARTRSRPGLWTLAGAGGLAVGAAVLGTVALQARGQFGRTSYEREALDARDRYQRFGTTAVGLATGAAVAALVGTVLWLRPP